MATNLRKSSAVKARQYGKIDWARYPGSHRWPNGDEPVIRELAGWMVTAERKFILAFEASEAAAQWDLIIELPTQKLALALLNGLPEDFHPGDYGFIRST